ncbi:hypothetical protein OIO90_001498 [Microbotryomycetes sp. JL221]|nr:hypothetical protein OIO90_001498 [Microbotryomycetes sp. JL221]
MRALHLVSVVTSIVNLASQVSAWGAAGHETVATIAQIHLKPATRDALKLLLPYSNGYMPPIASWADRIRGVPMYHFASELHYTSPLDDLPPDECHFGDRGFKTDHDLLHAITNYTSRLLDNPDDYVALKFLVHFIGDAHQPLHLTNRDRGGNSFPVTFEGRHMNLHGLWDNQLIAKALRDQSNYTRPLPARQIEDNLRGAIYAQYPNDSVWEVICPVYWATETHRVTCERTFPHVKEGDQPSSVPELFTKEYYNPIRDNNIIEKALAQGGLRLAAALNVIFSPPTRQELDSLYNGGDSNAFVDLSWLEQ